MHTKFIAAAVPTIILHRDINLKELDRKSILKLVRVCDLLIFDVGGTLADKDTVSPSMVRLLAELINEGRHVAIASAKSIGQVRPWIEGEDGIIRQVKQELWPRFLVYSDRMTKWYQVNDAAVLHPQGVIPFSRAVNQEEVLRIAEQAAEDVTRGLLCDDSVSEAVRSILRNNPFRAQRGDAFIQVTSAVSVGGKGDASGVYARTKLSEALVSRLHHAGLLSDDIMVILDGERGAFIRNKQATKAGAVSHMLSSLRVRHDRTVYFGDQFAGRNIADLGVAGTDVLCINTGPDRDRHHPRIYDLTGGPAALQQFLADVVGAQLPRQ